MSDRQGDGPARRGDRDREGGDPRDAGAAAGAGGDRQSGGKLRDSRSRSSEYYERRRRRRGRKTKWDIKPPNWVEGMPMPGVAAGAALGGAGVGTGAGALPSQQTRHARRLYVGNLPAVVSEMELRDFFKDMVARACTGIPGANAANPILSVYSNPERKFAFVEFSTMELTAACLAMDGIMFNGSDGSPYQLRVRRPNDFKPELVPIDLRERGPPIDSSKLPMGAGAGLGGGGGGGSGGGPKIFVGGLPSGILEPQLHQLFSAFGPVRALNLVKDPSGASRGYGFVEYQDPSVIQLAVSTLHGTTLGDRSITVQVSKAPGADSGAGSGSGANTVPLGTPAAGMMAPAAPAAPAATSRVLCLENMVTSEDLRDDGEYRELCGEIQEECGKYGSLEPVIIPRIGQPGEGRVFLVYGDAAAAGTAFGKLHGRTFGEAAINAKFYDEATLRSGNMTA